MRAAAGQCCDAPLRRRTDRSTHPLLERIIVVLLGQPGSKSEPSARTRHAREFRRDCGVVGREDDADRRGHDVEALILIRERLAVGDLERELEARFRCAPLGCLDQYGCKVGSGHNGPSLCRSKGDVSSAAGQIQPPHARLRLLEIGPKRRACEQSLRPRARTGRIPTHARAAPCRSPSCGLGRSTTDGSVTGPGSAFDSPKDTSDRAARCASVQEYPLKPYPPAVGLTGVDGNERVLGVARRDDDEPTHRTIARVPDGVRGTPGYKDEAAARQLGPRDHPAGTLHLPPRRRTSRQCPDAGAEAVLAGPVETCRQSRRRRLPSLPDQK